MWDIDFQRKPFYRRAWFFVPLLLLLAALIAAGLVVNADRMRQNLELSRGVVFSGTVLLELAQRGVSREQAYEWVQRNALRSYDEQKDFKQLLLADKDVMGVLDSKTVEHRELAVVQLDRDLHLHLAIGVYQDALHAVAQVHDLPV